LFYPDGKLKYYLYNRKGKLNIFKGFGDVQVCKCWKNTKDSLFIQAAGYKKVNESDSLILLTNHNNEQFVFKASNYPMDKLDLNAENR